MNKEKAIRKIEKLISKSQKTVSEESSVRTEALKKCLEIVKSIKE